jgi:cytoskeletal protein CcmA (bactofilin family)
MKSFFVLFSIFFTSLCAFNCSGTEVRASRGGETLLASGDTHDGWYFAGSPQVDIDGTVNGDAFVAGGVVNVKGTVNGLLVVAGGQVNVTGIVTDRIICCGGVIRIAGKIEKSVFAGGGSVIIERGATVGEYLMAGASDVQMRGEVERDAKIGATDLFVRGKIKGNLDAAVENFTTEEGSFVGGNLTVTAKDSERIRIAPGTVVGQVHLKAGREASAPRTLGLTTGRLVFGIIFLLSLCATALVLSFLFPRQLASVGTIINGRPGESVLVGLAALILGPLLCVVLFLTVLGFPLGLFLFFYLCWLAFLSQMSLGILLGYRIFGFDGKSGWALFGPVALGILAVHICTYIPFVNVVVIAGGLILGVGALAIITQEQFVHLRSR